MNKAFLDSTLTMIPGFFENTMPHVKLRPIAFLHLDVDLYQSYLVTLRALWPMVIEGGVVLFDEFDQQKCRDKFPGAEKSIAEFFGPRVSEMRYNKQADRHYIIK